MDKATKKIYIKRFDTSRRKSAVITDWILGSLITYAISALIFRELGASTVAASVCGAWAAAIFALSAAILRSASFERFVKRERKGVLRDNNMRKLLMCTETDFRRIAQGAVDKSCDGVYLHQSQKQIDTDKILSVYRTAKEMGQKKVAIFSIGELDEEASAMLGRLTDIEVNIIKADTVFSSCKISDEAADAMYVREHDTKKKPLRERIKLSARPTGYIICGTALFLMSFVMRYTLYYRTIGGVCLWIGAFLYFREDKGRR